MKQWLFVLLCILLVSFSGCRRADNASQATGRSAAVAPTETRQPAIHGEIGFATRQKLLDHYEKHGREFGAISQGEYLRQAQTLRDARAGGNVLESVRRDGVITRFDRETGTFLAFDSDLTIRTCFKPNAGENYFRRQSKR